MADTKLKTTILKTLQKIPEIWADEQKNILNETKLFDLLDTFGKNNNALYKKIIASLLSVPSLKKHFFMPIKNVYVFKTRDFKFFIEENKINNSYTQYENKIGLSDGDRFLNESHDIVLNFPYKDCVLEGGQSTEEGTDTYFEYSDKKKKYIEKKTKSKNGGKTDHKNKKKASRKEIFFNEILAYDEIDRLFDEKALVNWKRFTKNGTSEVKKIDRDADGTIKENLIIKGNNLLTLHSLRRQFTRKVKLIYIDPPYNTGSDGFKYNDNFNHSTWLTFMKNRLEVAKEFLRDDGVIFVQCDDNEQAYLKVLMDEIFNRDNFVTNITVEMSLVQGMKVGAAQKGKIVKNSEYILVYSKQPDWKVESILYDGVSGYDYHFSIFLSENNGEYQMMPIGEWLKKQNTFSKYFDKYRLLPSFDSFKELMKISDDFKKLVYQKYADCLHQSLMASINIPDNIKKRLDNNEVVKYKKYILYQLDSGKIRQLQPLSATLGETDDYVPIFGRRRIRGNLWKSFYSDMGNVAKEDTIDFKNGKKPQRLIQQIIKMTTNKNDIVLDYHLGSGTTAAVAHKMGRRYIGIEQMDYIETIAVERLKKVIAGEQGGISKSINWKGGGEFIYFELAEWNEQARKEINACKNLTELKNLFNTLCRDYFLNYNITIKEFQESIIKENNFIKLSLPEQKRMFLKMLDLNHMYIPRSEMNDKKFKLNKKDMKLTEKFYHHE
ncbi:methyltransferase [Spirochaetota bacterium]|nr:methyltransferase [Spirochaetota bacterium]